MEITICLPVRNRPQMANECLNSIINCCNHKIILIDDFSNHDQKQYINNKQIEIIYNNYKSSLTQMWAQFCQLATTDYVIILCDKIRLTKEDIERFEKYFNLNYALVATWAFGIFGFKKDLLNIIGEFDVNYISNGWEDTDIYHRMFMNNLAIYASKETTYLDTGTSWGSASLENKEYFEKKWEEGNTFLKQKIPDVYKNTILNHNYKKWDESIILIDGLNNFYKNKERIREG